MEENIVASKKVFEQICAVFDAHSWKYKRTDEKLEIFIGINGEDIPMPFFIRVDPNRCMIKFQSPMPFTFPEDKRVDGAIAACAATYGLSDGFFDYGYDTGRIVFRITAFFRDREVTEELLNYMIDCSCAVVDHYNDKFEALASGKIEIDEFMKD